MNKPLTTLFMLISADGKISTGDNDLLDVDKDFPRIVGVKEGLQQYYNIEKTTDLVSFNSGRVMEKVGANKRSLDVKKGQVSFVVVDSKPHLNDHGCEYFAKRSKTFYVITTNKNHPAFSLETKFENIKILYYPDKIDFVDVFRQLKEKYGIELMTIQTGGTLNAEFLHLKLLDKVSLVVAPCFIGGKYTQSLIGGESIHTENDLSFIKALKLTKCDILENSYLHLQYDIINETYVDSESSSE